MTGGAIGSLMTQVRHLTAAERKTLLMAGAAAGMAATFNSPVAAVLPAVELSPGSAVRSSALPAYPARRISCLRQGGTGGSSGLRC
ncbi:chloride channel protein [Streptomyces sp. NPDC008001]|uniref:chloride channel protein n=1 Tax=Streptomyces sp. NPDC008001 TaxID=3364804 RepID=UPI0036E315EF